MRALALSVCLLLAPAAAVPAPAQSASAHRDDLSRVPLNILDGLDLLRRDAADAPEEAEKSWLRGSALPDDGTTSANLRTFKRNDGDYQGFEVVSAQDLTQRIRVIYLALNYERQPHIVKLVVYRSGNGYILLQVNTNVDETTLEAVLQQSLAQKTQ